MYDGGIGSRDVDDFAVFRIVSEVLKQGDNEVVNGLSFVGIAVFGCGLAEPEDFVGGVNFEREGDFVHCFEVWRVVSVAEISEGAVAVVKAGGRRAGITGDIYFVRREHKAKGHTIVAARGSCEVL